MQAQTEWKYDNIFEGRTESGNTVTFDAGDDHAHGPSPMEAVLMALCGCTSVDVVSILKKKRQPVTGLRVSAVAERAETSPRVFTAIKLTYAVSGRLSRKAVEDAVALWQVALEADAMHLRTDVYTSVGVLGGLVAIKITGITMLDPIIAIVVALMIIKAAWELTQTAFFHILDVKLPDNEEALIHEVMERYRGRFIEYHKLRTRKSGHLRHIDMHLVVPKQITVEAGHALSHQISADIEKSLPYSQILVHIEPCPGGCERCAEECPKTGAPRPS